jgi:hypothetical protein
MSAFTKFNDFFGSKAAPFVAFLVLGGAFGVITQHGQDNLKKTQAHLKKTQAQQQTLITTQTNLVNANCQRLNVQLATNNRNQLADFISETADLRVFKLVQAETASQPGKEAKAFETDIDASVTAKKTSLDSKVWTPLVACSNNTSIHYHIDTPIHFVTKLPPKSALTTPLQTTNNTQTVK